jgi:microcompartment protein CcmL/EutN
VSRIGSGLAVVEVTGLCPSLVVLDAMEKASGVRLLQAELNDFYGVCMKVRGDAAQLRAAVAAGQEAATRMGARCVATVIDAPDRWAWKAIESPPEFSPLIQAEVVFIPAARGAAGPANVSEKESAVSESPYAIGMIETQGFTAVIEAIDTACKAANVEVIGKEKLGGGYVTVLIRGDVAAVKAAVQAGEAKVNGLGKLIAAHVIPRPSQAILGLLPKA